MEQKVITITLHGDSAQKLKKVLGAEQPKPQRIDWSQFMLQRFKEVR